MTDSRTVVAHLVTDDAVAAGRRAGRYVGVCGGRRVAWQSHGEHRPVLPVLPRLDGSAVTAVTEWLVLLRVHEGGVTALGGASSTTGQPVADHLAATLDALIRTTHLALGRATPGGYQHVCVTHAGQVRYAELTSTGVREAGHGR